MEIHFRVLADRLVLGPDDEEAMTTRPLLQRYEPDMKYIGSGESIPCLSADPGGECVLYVDHLADRAALLAEIERLEARVPKFVSWDSDERRSLMKAGWLGIGDDELVGSKWHRLMVPPIPLPEPKGDAG